MSLLIKALNKAEQAQAQNAKTEQTQVEKAKVKAETINESDLDLDLEDLGFSLSPSASNLAESSAAPKAKASAAASNNVQSSNQASKAVAASSSVAATGTSAAAKSAANVFSSKGVDVSEQNTALALLAGAGLIALLAMGLYYYQFADNTPDLVIPPRPLEQIAATQQPEVIPTLPSQTSEVQVTEPPAPLVAASGDEVPPPAELQEVPIKQMAKKPVVSEKPALTANEEVIVADNETILDETAIVASSNKKRGQSKRLQFGESIASPSASINVSKTKSEPAGVNPVLMSAYEAYNAGDDANAQKLYKQVLQRDVRNVDALLGLGAIASRQGREADANGWFGKVLEVDPRNSMAQAAMLDNLPQGNEANSESRIKNMLAKHPDDANLHVALGNLYAEQNQWPAAQQAYFDAYSLQSSAENAFNLAVSLDQMGKPKLALPYYQRALEQASSTSSIDKAALEARIMAIQ